MGTLQQPNNGPLTAPAPATNGQQFLVPKKMFFTKGVGSHKQELRSFELALRDAGIEKCNIVHVSSIFPPNCELISKNEGLRYIYPGMITFAVTARVSSNEARRLIAASIGCAIPSDSNTYGYLSEYYAFGQTEKEAGDTAEDLAAAMLASTLGIEFDEDKGWDEKEDIFRISDKIVKTTNVTQSAMVDKGCYTTVVAAGVFIFLSSFF
jgi:arginine decarboxylase